MVTIVPILTELRVICPRCLATTTLPPSLLAFMIVATQYLQATLPAQHVAAYEFTCGRPGCGTTFDVYVNGGDPRDN